MKLSIVLTTSILVFFPLRFSYEENDVLVFTKHNNSDQKAVRYISNDTMDQVLFGKLGVPDRSFIVRKLFLYAGGSLLSMN